ncbi:ubiquitin carboxyl-terminal hydrolase 36-like [Anopheles maculipalpis]|uniref:ubiquitin carboxyl-terminal hydrolase 36-like n=1 Tax=Anopheles maculipalpis TaxID=1496333 RepID=UPI002159377C|nr:ubiquitin carboxyl-terminal hydrolase 36-like [Anopheles maculipalpis]
MEMDPLQTQIQAELPFCRLCFSQACDLYELFPGAGNDNESLLLKILELVNVAINFDEDLNSYICGKCVTMVEDFFEYKEKVKENDLLLREKRKSVDHATAIYNVVSMQPDATNSSASNGATGAGSGSELGAGGIDEPHVGLDQRISIDGGPPLNGNIIEFKKQLFTASPSQIGIWLCVASGSDIQCPAAIEVDDNIQVVAEIGQHNHGLPVSVPENPPETPPTKQQHQQQQQPPHQQPQPAHHHQQTHNQPAVQEHHAHEEDTIVVTTDGTPAILSTTAGTPVVANSGAARAAGAGNKASSTSTSSAKKKKPRDQPSKRKVSNDILVGDGWLTDVTTYKRNHYQLVTKDGYQTFLIYNGYRFRTQQKIRNGIAAWKCAWNGRKGCQAILHITEDYQKVREVGSPHNHEPSLRDRIISNKPTNGNTSDQSLIMQSDSEELSEMHKITATAASVGSTSSGAGTLTGETITLGGGATVVAITTTGANASVNSSTSTTAAAAATLDLTSEMDFVQQSSNSGSELITTTTTTSTSGGSSTTSADQPGTTTGHHQPHHHHHHHHHPHHEVVGVVDEVVGKDDTTMSMDIEEIIRPHVVLHPASE